MTCFFCWAKNTHTHSSYRAIKQMLNRWKKSLRSGYSVKSLFCREKAECALWFAQTYGLTPQSLLLRDKTGNSFNLNLNCSHSQGNTTHQLISSIISFTSSLIKVYNISGDSISQLMPWFFFIYTQKAPQLAQIKLQEWSSKRAPVSNNIVMIAVLHVLKILNTHYQTNCHSRKTS